MITQTLALTATGVGIGGIAFCVCAQAFSSWMHDPFAATGAVFSLVVVACIAAVAGRLRPFVGLVAGLAILAAIGVAWGAGVADPWVENSGWADWRSIWVGGSGNLVTPIVGSVFCGASAAQWLSVRYSRRQAASSVSTIVGQ